MWKELRWLFLRNSCYKASRVVNSDVKVSLGDLHPRRPFTYL